MVEGERTRAGEAIREALRLADISQSEMARRIGKHPQSFSRSVNGPWRPSYDLLFRIYQELRQINLPVADRFWWAIRDYREAEPVEPPQGTNSAG